MKARAESARAYEMVGGGLLGVVVLTYSCGSAGPRIVSSAKARGTRYKQTLQRAESTASTASNAEISEVSRCFWKRSIYRDSTLRAVPLVVPLELDVRQDRRGFLNVQRPQIAEPLGWFATDRTTCVERLIGPGFTADFTAPTPRHGRWTPRGRPPTRVPLLRRSRPRQP